MRIYIRSPQPCQLVTAVQADGAPSSFITVRRAALRRHLMPHWQAIRNFRCPPASQRLPRGGSMATTENWCTFMHRVVHARRRATQSASTQAVTWRVG